MSTAASNLGRMALPLGAMLIAMAGFQIGAGFAQTLFPVVGPLGAATLRLVLGAVMLVAIARPWRAYPTSAPLWPLIGLGAATAMAISMFYLSISRLPQGVAVSLQFLGPLAIAVFGSRRPIDLVWAGMAALSVWLLVAAGQFGTRLDLLGVAFALAAAAGWGAYIVLGRIAGAIFGPSTAALAVSVAALMIIPAGAPSIGRHILDLAILPMALLVALLSTAMPFFLEFYALRRLPARTFAIFTSLEPSLGVMAAFVMMNQRLTPAQLAGVFIVMVAAAGSAWTSEPAAQAPDIT